MAAYKIGAEGGDAICQHQLGTMYDKGQGGVDVDDKQAVAWYEKAAAQDFPSAVNALGVCAKRGEGMTPSWRRAREYYQRAIDLGHSLAVEGMQNPTSNIQQVTHCPPGVRSRLRIPCGASPRNPIRSTHRTHSAPPSWTSGWRSSARPART